MRRAYEAGSRELEEHAGDFVSAVFADLTSSFLVMSKGPSFVEYPRFREAYEILKRRTGGFGSLRENLVWNAVREDPLTLLVVRTMLGMTPPEWAEITREETGESVTLGFARTLDNNIRADPHSMTGRLSSAPTHQRVDAMIRAACVHLTTTVLDDAEGAVHRLNKFDTAQGLDSMRNAADNAVPYAVLLYERYLGRPFASHRDSVSELVGDVMESAIEERLTAARITFRKTKRAERVPGFEQAPDFIIPDEIDPKVVIEAKVAGDDGTARDKVARIIRLTTLSQERAQSGKSAFEVVACIDGRGFGVRAEDMRQLLMRTNGKVFTLANLDDLIRCTGLAAFLPE